MTTDLTTDQETIVLLLRRIHFFDGLKYEELERLARLVSILKVNAGEIIFRRNDPPEAFYIIEHGRVEILRETLVGTEVIAALGRSGDFFGEMALIESRPRSSTVRAETSVELLVIARPDFETLMHDYPSIHFEVTKALSHNLRRSDTQFVDIILEKNRQLTQALSDLKNAQEELIKQERLSLVGRLAAGIIHDLKKPLTCISGYAQLLARDKLPSQKRQNFSDTITREVQRLVTMANEIRNFAQGDHEVQRRQVDFRTWFSEIEQVLTPEFESSSVSFVRHLHYQGSVWIDPERFKTVIYHLSARALSALSPGGKFTLTCQQDHERFRLECADTGAGMEAEVQSRIFEDFFSPRQDGAGLGMAIVKRIVEAHQGTIAVKSELNKGTTFIIQLPLEQP